MIAGYSVTTPKFQSEGGINISPLVIRPTVDDAAMPMYNLFIATQTSIIQGTDVAEEALRNPTFKDAWDKAYGEPMMSPPDFVAALDAERAKAAATLIKVSFTDRNKAVAEAGAKSAIAAYMKLYGNADNTDRARKLKFLIDKQSQLAYSLKLQRDTLQKLAERFGTTDLTVRNQTVQEELARLDSELSKAQIDFQTATATQQNKPVGDKTNKEFAYQQIAANDVIMRNLLQAREQAGLDLEAIKKTYGDKHPQVARYSMNLDHTNRKVDDYARDYLQRNLGKIPYGLEDGTASNLSLLKAKMDVLKKQREDQLATTIDIGTQRQRIDEVNREIARLETESSAVTHSIETLQAEQELAQNIKVLGSGSEAVLTGDKRKLAAGVGFVFGGLLPIGLMLMYGMIDLRFRYSDDTSDSDLAGVSLLGILPNLPDRLSDPQQAGIAAHCVHQIRTMLQINRTNDEPQVIAVTSAAPGDGKTSLTLALGLSYAACGARTLLIDCDLVAAGLSHRLNVNSPDGVLEAVANRALLEYVRTTDIADVAILPVGTTHAHHASTLSPVALRRLLNESKKHFDVILVDTGPILGSIEASLVCAAADRTILTVARGQQRPLVERSIGHLQAIGSRLAGVVFNRAQARDFERSLSGLALRSRPANGNAATPGAAAKAVAGSFKRAG